MVVSEWGTGIAIYYIYIYTSIYILRVYRKSNGVGGGRRRLSRLTGVDRTRGFHVIMTSCLNSKPDMCRGRTRVRNVPRSHQRPRFCTLRNIVAIIMCALTYVRALIDSKTPMI